MKYLAPPHLITNLGPLACWLLRGLLRGFILRGLTPQTNPQEALQEVEMVPVPSYLFQRADDDVVFTCFKTCSNKNDSFFLF
jgi:hypothetical protein